jgi:ubiquinone/menaquinone biosynthesis C-methylase UbiE
MSLPSTSTLLNSAAVLEKIAPMVGTNIADLGCGSTGHFVVPAARMIGGNGKVYAVDILRSALSGVESRARLEGIGNIETVWGNCELPGGVRIPDATVGVAMVINNLFCAKDRIAFLREAARITKPGGKIAVIDWKAIATPLGPEPARRVSSETVRLEGQSLDLKVADSWDPGKYFWGLIFIK